jgi:hypothetical protein
VARDDARIYLILGDSGGKTSRRDDAVDLEAERGGSALSRDRDMKVLLTYSEGTSREFAGALSDWIRHLLPLCSVGLSAPDLETRAESADVHAATCICVTPEALDDPGLFFAAGAAYPATPNGIAVPVVLDLEPEDLGDTPLTVFQAARADYQGLLALATTLNETITPALSEIELFASFESLWPEFEERLRSVPGAAPRKLYVTVATSSFLKTFPYDYGGADGLWTETLLQVLGVLSEPGSPVSFPKLDYAGTRLLDVERERWIEPPKLLSRVRSNHVAFVDPGALEVWGESPWLLAAMIRARAAAGRSIAQDPETGNFYLAP